MLKLWVPLWGALVAPAAQSASQAPDSAVLRRYADAVYATADTLDVLRGVTQAFKNDLKTASPTLVLARATSVQNACSSGVTTVRQLQGMLAARSVTPKSAPSQAKFRTAAEETVAALERCVRNWQPLPRTDARADTLRAWGPYRANEIEVALRRFDVARFTFAAAAELPKRPVK